MAQQTERDLQAMHKAMRTVFAASPLPATALVIGALRDLTDVPGEGENPPRHSDGFLRLQYLAALYPEMAEPVKHLSQLVIADTLPAMRQILAGGR